MNILDELERLITKPELVYEERHLLELYYQEALPALIRVARAAKELSANAYRDCEDYYAVETLCMANLEEALQQLRALGEGK